MLRPGKRYLAKTVPAMSEVSITEAVLISAIIAELRKKRPKGAVSKAPVKLAVDQARGKKTGGQMAISAADLKAVTNIHSIGITITRAPAISTAWQAARAMRRLRERCCAILKGLSRGRRGRG